MVGFAVEFVLVLAVFATLWRRQVRERRRASEQADQLNLDFTRRRNPRGAESVK